MSEQIPTLLKFLRSDMSSPTGTGKWTVGRWRSVHGEIVPCRNGLHATTAANLIPFFSDTLWRVEIGGEYVWHGEAGTPDHKLVARRMRLVERIEAWNEQSMRLFAADCAERVLHLFEEQYPDDKRPREAVEVARRYARGEATLAELKAAANANAYAYAAFRDELLAMSAEIACEALIACGSEGAAFLFLCDEVQS